MKTLKALLTEVFWEKLLVILTAVIVLLGGVFWFQKGLPSSHDSFAHITYAKIFFQALQQGQFPVRWVEWVQNGYNMPLFNFYQVGFYYLTSLVMLFLPSVAALKLTVYLLWIISTFFIYLLTKKYGTIPALAGTLLYVFSPYLILDIFIRGSLPEFAVTSLLPILLWSIEQLLTESKNIFIVSISLLLGLMIVTHMPATIIFAPVILGFCLHKLGVLNNQVKLVKLGAAFLIGVALSAFYLFPAIFELKLISINDLTKQAFDFHKNFPDPRLPISYIWGYNGAWWGESFTRSIGLGLLTTWVLISSLAVSVWTLFKKQPHPILGGLFLWIIVVAYGYFFAFKASLLFWEHLKTLRFIQFPWRFLMVLPIAQSFLGAVIISLLKRKDQLIFTSMILMATLFFNFPFLQPRTFFDEKILNAPLSSWPTSTLTREEAFIEPGYLPKGVSELPQWGLPKLSVLNNQATVQILDSSDTNLKLSVNTPTVTTLTINSHNFPGWKLWVDGRETKIIEDNQYHFISVETKAGSHTIQAKFQNTPVRYWSNLLSLGALGVVCLLFIYYVDFYSIIFNHHKAL